MTSFKIAIQEARDSTTSEVLLPSALAAWKSYQYKKVENAKNNTGIDLQNRINSKDK